MSIGSCDDLIYEGIKYATDKGKEKREKILKKATVEDIADPITEEGIGMCLDNIQTEEEIEKGYFKELIN